MKFSFGVATTFAAGAFSMPAAVLERQVTPIYGPSFPVIDSVCPAPSSQQPLGGIYPVASFLGTFITPTLDAIIGPAQVEMFE